MTFVRYEQGAERLSHGGAESIAVLTRACAQVQIRQHRAGLIEDEALHDLERDLDLEETTVRFQRGGHAAGAGAATFGA